MNPLNIPQPLAQWALDATRAFDRAQIQVRGRPATDKNTPEARAIRAWGLFNERKTESCPNPATI